jgi:uncharacterized protein (DUF2147 family)
MKVFSLFLLASLFCGEASPAAAGSIEGLWLVENKEAHIRVEQCGENLCARIVWMKEPTDETGRPRLDVNNPDKSLRNRPILGIDLLKEVPAEPDADGLWSGRIYDPERGRYFRCTLRLDGPDHLRLRGYLGISLLGRTTRWTRIPEKEWNSRPSGNGQQPSRR